MKNRIIFHVNNATTILQMNRNYSDVSFIVILLCFPFLKANIFFQ